MRSISAGQYCMRRQMREVSLKIVKPCRRVLLGYAWPLLPVPLQRPSPFCQRGLCARGPRDRAAIGQRQCDPGQCRGPLRHPVGGLCCQPSERQFSFRKPVRGQAGACSCVKMLAWWEMACQDRCTPKSGENNPRRMSWRATWQSVIMTSSWSRSGIFFLMQSAS